MRKMVTLYIDLITSVNDLSRKEKPQPSFDEMINRLAWKGLTTYQQSMKFCYHCGQKIVLSTNSSKFCDRCGIVLDRK